MVPQPDGPINHPAAFAMLTPRQLLQLMGTRIHLGTWTPQSSVSPGVRQYAAPELIERSHRRSPYRATSVRILILFLIASSVRVTAQPTDPISIGLATGSVSGRTGPWSPLVNPSSGSDEAIGLVAAAIGGFPGGVPDAIALYSGPLAATFNINVSLSRFGSGPWREIDGAVGASGLFGRLQVGLRLHANSVSIDRYGSSLHPTLDGGLSLPLDSTVRLGIAIQNMTGTARLDHPLRQSIAAGVAIATDTALLLLVDVTSVLNHGLSIRLGTEYELIAGLSGRVGLATDPLTAAFGFGLVHGRFRFDYGASLRPNLGLIHAVGGGMSW